LKLTHKQNREDKGHSERASEGNLGTNQKLVSKKERNNTGSYIIYLDLEVVVFVSFFSHFFCGMWFSVFF